MDYEKIIQILGNDLNAPLAQRIRNLSEEDRAALRKAMDINKDGKMSYREGSMTANYMATSNIIKLGELDRSLGVSSGQLEIMDFRLQNGQKPTPEATKQLYEALGEAFGGYGNYTPLTNELNTKLADSLERTYRFQVASELQTNSDHGLKPTVLPDDLKKLLLENPQDKGPRR